MQIHPLHGTCMRGVGEGQQRKLKLRPVFRVSTDRSIRNPTLPRLFHKTVRRVGDQQGRAGNNGASACRTANRKLSVRPLCILEGWA